MRPLLPDGTQGLRGGSLLFYAGRVAGAAAAYAAHACIAHWIGKGELGRYSAAFALCLVLSDLALLGMPMAGLRFVAEHRARGDHARLRGYVRRTGQISLGVSAALAVAGSALVLLAWPPAQHPGSRATLVALAALPALTLLRYFVSTAHALKWFKLVVIPMTVVRPVVFLALVAAMWAAGVQSDAAEVMGLHAGLIVLTLIGVGAAVRTRVRSVVGEARPVYETDRWVRTAAPLLMVSVFNGFLPEISIVLLGTLASDGDVAVFSAAIRTAFLIGFGLHAVDQATLPRVSQAFATGDKAAMQRILVRATRLKFASAVVGILGLALIGKPLLSLFGADFVLGYSALIVLAAAQVCHSAIGPVAQVLAVTGHQNASSIACSASLAALAGLTMVLVPPFGIQGAAIAVFLVTVASGLWMLRLVVHHVGVVPSLLASTACSPSTSTVDS